jgi:hypothetical protein
MLYPVQAPVIPSMAIAVETTAVMTIAMIGSN